MGKCVSKNNQVKIREIDERSYIAITDDFEYYQYDGDDDASDDYYYGGQTESKKKMPGRETKGTSISFGFKKNKNIAANKKLNIANNNNEEKEEQQKATIIPNHTVIHEHNNFIIADDNNGNSKSTVSKNIPDAPLDESKDVNRTISPAKLQPAKRDQLLVGGKSNRFGFRQNVVRPTSSTIQPRLNEFGDNVNNNYKTTCNNIRSKSALQRSNNIAQYDKVDDKKTSGSNLLPTSYHQTQNELNANSIVNSTINPPKSIVLSRYTLHSTSLPRPQYAVPVNVMAPSNSNYYRNATLTTNSFNSTRPTTSPYMQNKLIDTKGAKHQANLNRRILTRRDESLDSGIHSHDSTASSSDQHHHQHQEMETQVSLRKPHQKSRRFEMIPIPGRHKFEIRDLNEFNEDTKVIPLSLPKLPIDRKETVTRGLIRSTNSYSNTDSEMDMSVSGDSRPSSFISTTSEAESYEEEKLKLDTSSSEKSSKGAISKSYKISSSMSSSKLAFLGLSESMISNMSISITENNSTTCDDDVLSSATMTAGYSDKSAKDQKETVNDAYLKQKKQENPKIASISRKEFLIEMDEKFAETIEATKDLTLIDDETSPSDSLVSSSDSGGDLFKKKQKTEDENKPCDSVKEQDLEDITPELVEDLISPGSPTHASNSLSLSDGGRDFLIDDEIADQPALLISNKKQRGSVSHNDEFKATTSLMSDATPTLRDISAHGSIKSLNKLQNCKAIHSGKSSPAVNRKGFERTGSLDTLSPCDSIASDDLMADFDLGSSIDSIERREQSFDSLVNSSVLNGNIGKEFSGGVLKTTKQQNILRRDNLTSQLPARATRLLQRRLQNNNNSPLSHHGSDSPQSLDSAQSRVSSTTARASLREHLKQKQQLNLKSHLINSSNEDLLADKSLQNAMLQDVATFKKQLVQLRRILQEDEDNLLRSDTLNPFEINGQIFNNNYNSNGSDKEKCDDDDEKQNLTLTSEQLILLEDQRQELSDLRRQVVFLQSQIDDKDRTIKTQQNKLEQLEREKAQLKDLNLTAATQATLSGNKVETANCATQTERLRPISMGQDFTSPLNATNKENKSTIPTIIIKSSPTRSKSQLSSVFATMSSVKATSIPTSGKPMKSTKIEYPVRPSSIKRTTIPSSPLNKSGSTNKISPTKISSISTSSSCSSLNNSENNRLLIDTKTH